jgi:Fe2+ transport system protein FeoA
VDADDQDIQRLMSMGLCSGRTIELIKQGDPMIVRVFGSRVGISRRLGEKVMVQVCGQTGCDPAVGDGEEVS